MMFGYLICGVLYFLGSMAFNTNSPFAILAPVSIDEIGRAFLYFGDFPQEVFFLSSPPPSPVMVKNDDEEEVSFRITQKGIDN